MALALPTQWTLLASALMAHADHVMAGEECERLMAMIDAEVDGEEYAQWMGVIGDRAQLEAMLDGLEAPPADTHREILEQAWLMAVVDGERDEAEHEALERIAGKLGVESVQLEFWREAWNQAQAGYAQTATAAGGYVLGGEAPVAAEDHAVLKDFVMALPTTHEQRESLATAGETALPGLEVAAKVRGLSRLQKRDLIVRLWDVVGQAAQGDDAMARWRKLGAAAGLTDDELATVGD